MNEDRPPSGWVKLDYSELYFIIARFLEESPCHRAAKVLCEELEEKQLLIRSKTWEGEDKVLNYEEIVKRNPHISSDYLPLVCSELCSRLESTRQCRAQGKHSLIGNGVSTCIYNKNLSSKKGSSLYSIVNERIGFSTSHLENSSTVNQCHILSTRHISSHFNYTTQLYQPQLFFSMKKHRAILGHLAPVFCVAFDVTGQRIITGADDDLAKVWCAQTGQLLATLRGHNAEITDVSISWDNGMIATGSLDKTVRVWCGESSTPLAVLCGHAGHITSVQFSPSPMEDCRYLASTAKDGCLCFWKWDPDIFNFMNVPVKFMEKNRVGDQTLCSAFSPGGKFYVTGGTDRIVRVYQCNPDPPILLAELSGHQDRIMTIQFSNTGQCQFATGSCDGTAHLWQYRQCKWTSIVLVADVDRAKCTKKDKSLAHQVTMVGWERTDTYLVTAHSPDCHLRVWRARTGELVSVLKGHNEEVFVVECHPKESRVLLTAGHDGCIMIWDMLSGDHLKMFKIEYENEGIPCIFDCKWSPDGLSYAAADSFGYLTIFGFGSSIPYEQHPDEQFFHTDYRPLMRDRNHFVIDEQGQLPPHLLPPPYLVDIDGHPHPAKYQEAILKLIRPAKLVEQDKRAEDLEDYDEYMKMHFAKFREHGHTFERNREPRDRISLIGERGQSLNDVSNAVGGDVGMSTPPPQLSPHDDNESRQLTGYNSMRETEENRRPPVVQESQSDEVVDVMEDNGQEDNIKNMLSSIVYSLGLNEEEARVAIGYWHSRVIIPSLDSSIVSSEQARLTDIQETEEMWYRQESEKPIELPSLSPPSVSTPQGRALRSGRTIDTEEVLPLFSPSVKEDASDQDSEVESINGAWESGSTASSDISDWTNEAGLSIISPSHKRTRRIHRRESTISEAPSEMTIDNEQSDTAGEESGRRRRAAKKNGSVSSDQTTTDESREKKKKAMKTPIRREVDYTVYWPPDWLKMTRPQITPYFPQVGDIVIYCFQGHKLYRDEVRKQRIYQWKNQQMPWQKYHLRPQEICQVKNVHFVVGPPTLCSITLILLSPSSSNYDGPSTSQQDNKPITFTFKYHDMDGVLDFLILETTYKAGIRRQWTQGDRFRSMIDSSYWTGRVLKKQPYQDDLPNSHWQCFQVKWDDGATDLLSPWDMEPEGTTPSSPVLPAPEEVISAWGGEEEQARIIRGLEMIMEELEEAEMYVNSVDLEEEAVYCTVVPFPTDLTTITQRLKNSFYRRKLALIWEVILLHRNAASYNEEDSLIVKHSKILTQTLLKFINTPSISDPLECYEPRVNDEGTPQDVTAPEVETVEYLENEDVFTVSNDTIVSPRKRRIKLSSDDEDAEPFSQQESWHVAAETILNELCSHEDSSPFLEPVDIVLIPDYSFVIHNPMDLSTVRDKLQNEEYLLPKDFIQDVHLIFNNAKLYNQTRSQIYKMATELQKFFEQKIVEILKVSPDHTPVYNTRQALKRLATSLSSLDRGDPLSEQDQPNSPSSLTNGQGSSEGSEKCESDISYVEEKVKQEEDEGEELAEEEEEDGLRVELEEVEEGKMEATDSNHYMVTRSRSKQTVVFESRYSEEEEEQFDFDNKDNNYNSRKRHMQTRSSTSKRRRVQNYEELDTDEELGLSSDRSVTVSRVGRVSRPILRYS